MTSWIRVKSKSTASQGPAPFLFNFELTELCDQFNQYFYATLYSQSVNRPLAVYDRSNQIGPSFALIKETFQDVSGTTCVDSMIANATTLRQHDQARVIPYINGLSLEILHQKSASILEWSPSMIQKIAGVRTRYSVPDSINVGVQIARTVNARPVDTVAKVSAYIQAVREVNARLNSPARLSVFLMGDAQDVQEFKRTANSNWTIYSFPSAASNDFLISTLGQTSRVANYSEFIAALSCLQTSENLITSLSSNVGKFLYMTNTTMTSFRSMDVATFVAN
jgi:hypothetical protein